MASTTVLDKSSSAASQATIEQIVKRLRFLPPDRLEDVLQFVEFLDYKSAAEEDEALWEAVEANQKYKQEHPDEPLEQHTSGKEFLNAVKDL